MSKGPVALRVSCPGGQFKGGTSHPMTPAFFVFNSTDELLLLQGHYIIIHMGCYN